MIIMCGIIYHHDFKLKSKASLYTMMSLMAKNYKSSKLENGPSKACSNHYHHPTMVLGAAKASRGDVLAYLCFFFMFTIQKNIPTTPISSKQRGEGAPKFVESLNDDFTHNKNGDFQDLLRKCPHPWAKSQT